MLLTVLERSIRTMQSLIGALWQRQHTAHSDLSTVVCHIPAVSPFFFVVFRHFSHHRRKRILRFLPRVRADCRNGGFVVGGEIRLSVCLSGGSVLQPKPKIFLSVTSAVWFFCVCLREILAGSVVLIREKWSVRNEGNSSRTIHTGKTTSDKRIHVCVQYRDDRVVCGL